MIPIAIYRKTISPYLPPCCRFSPSCSVYAAQAILRFGAWKGGWLAFKRILRCNPFGGSGYDPVPELITHAKSGDSRQSEIR